MKTWWSLGFRVPFLVAMVAFTVGCGGSTAGSLDGDVRDATRDAGSVDSGLDASSDVRARDVAIADVAVADVVVDQPDTSDAQSFVDDGSDAVDASDSFSSSDAVDESDAVAASDTAPDAGCTPGVTACSTDGSSLLTCGPLGAIVTTPCASGCTLTGGTAACNVCVPASLSCSADGTSLITCPDGSATATTPCTHGCGTIAGAAACLPCAAGSVTCSADGGSVDTCSADGTTVTVAAGAFLTPTGTHPLALVATNMLDVEGTIDVSANGRSQGPGASALGTPAPLLAALCPGAGYGTRGGGGAFGGASYGTPDLVPLLSGSSGGSLLGHRVGAPAGGGGGGALQLVSCKGITAGAAGVIDAGGGGGAHSAYPSGGGSGGSVLIEAPHIELNANTIIVANGGGGGGLDTLYSTHSGGTDGSDGLLSAAYAPGGTDCAACGGLPEGGGGTASGPPTGRSGLHANGADGGVVGRIRINVRTGMTPTIDPASVVSPVASVGAVSVR